MAILQAIIAFIGRSVGKILNAIFGWAVTALFGRVTPREQTMLSAVVAAAAAWPLLLVGTIFPRAAAFVLAFVPLPHVAAWVVRLVWIGLALAVPFGVGVVMASRGNPDSDESRLKRLLRGFPVTVGIAGAFVLTFLTVPVLRLVSAVRRRRDVHMPLRAEPDGYDAVADRVEALLHERGFDAQPAKPPWWMTLPTSLLTLTAGAALRSYVPSRLAYWVGPDLTVALYPNGLLLRGEEKRAARAQGLLAEGLVGWPALQSTDPLTQDLEREIARVWRVLGDDRAYHEDSAVLLGRVRDFAATLKRIDVPSEDWQVVYRQTLQLERALHGQRQLLEPDQPKEAALMTSHESQNHAAEARTMPTRELVAALGKNMFELARKELELGKAEIRADVRAEIKTVAGLGFAVVGAILTLAMLLLAGVLALATMMAGWLAALIAAAGTLVVAVITGLVGWSKRVKEPLALTRRTLEEEARWLKERTA